MADDAIFFEGPDGLEEWPASGYATEDELQGLIDGRLVNRNITAKAPWMSCDEVLAAWDDLVGTVLDPWLVATSQQKT